MLHTQIASLKQNTMINHIFVPDNTISKLECVELGVLYTTAVLTISHNVNAHQNFSCLHCTKYRQLPVFSTKV